MSKYESNNCPCGRVGKKPLIRLNSPGFELLMRQILIYFDSRFTCIRTSKVFHFYFIFLDGNYRVLLTRAKSQKNPYNLNPVNSLSNAPISGTSPCLLIGNSLHLPSMWCVLLHMNCRNIPWIKLSVFRNLTHSINTTTARVENCYTK